MQRIQEHSRSLGRAAGRGGPRQGLDRLLGTVRAGRLGPVRLPAGWVGPTEHHEHAGVQRGGGPVLARRDEAALPPASPGRANQWQPLRHPGRARHRLGRRLGPEPFGAKGEYPWASWSPDGEQLACLAIKGISIVDVDTRGVVRTLPRKGFFQQLTWSPDGRWLSGVANSFGASWSVARMEIATGAARPSAGRLLHARLVPGQPGRHLSRIGPRAKSENNGAGWTQLWMADPDGRNRRLVYGEDGRHVYGGHVSPDGKYVDLHGQHARGRRPGALGLAHGPHAPGRCADRSAARAGSCASCIPEAKSGPVLVLPAGWEPCWTSAEIFASASAVSSAGTCRAGRPLKHWPTS